MPMTFLIVDLEWNGAWSKRAHGYFNEIIEIGAVRLTETMEETGRFHAVIRPQVSKKLSTIVTDLTNITEEELSDGTSFYKAMAGLRRFAGEGDRVLVTWSTTDLSVLMENCRFFTGDDRPVGFTHYADLQAYCQKQLGIDASRQPGLDNICERLGISEEGFSLHRAPDDACLTAEICRRMYEPAAFAPYVRKMDEEFFARARFKITPITDIHSPHLPASVWEFTCPDCGQPLRPLRRFTVRGRAFMADMVCKRCKKTYTARVQARLKYEGPDIRRRLNEKKPHEEEAKPADPPAAE